jgi:hypothetical protein
MSPPCKCDQARGGRTETNRRFRKDTGPLDRDRNRVRAHQFEKTPNLKFFQSLLQLEQLERFQAYVSALHHVRTRNVMYFNLTWGTSSPAHAGEDLANITVFGSINRVCNEYRVPKPDIRQPNPLVLHGAAALLRLQPD